MGSIRRNDVAHAGARASTPRRARHLAVRLAAVAGAAALLGLPATGAQAADAPPSTPLEQVQALVQPAVVYQQIEWTAWVYDETNKGYFTDKPFKVMFQCTGFVVNPTGYIGTAGHCVDYDAGVQSRIADEVAQWAYDNEYYMSKPPKSTIATFAKNWRFDGKNKQGAPDLSVNVAYGVSVSGEPSGKALAARVVGVRPVGEGDVALLKTDAQNLTVVPLSDNKDTRVGTQIVSVGYPLSVDLVTDKTYDPSFKEGSISAEKTTSGGLYQVYEISAAVSGGMSGGPTTTLNGDVVGVNSFGVSGSSQPFNFVQASKTLQELMRSEGIENTAGEVTDLYRAGLSAYFAGDRGAAIAAFQKTIEIVPSHEFAQDYLRKAQQLPESKRIFGLPLWLVFALVGFVLIIVAAAAVVFLLLRRRRRTPVGTSDAQPSPADATAPVPEAPAEGESPATEQEPPPSPENAAPTKLFCPECGEPHSADDHFCERCGHRLVQ